MTDEALPIGLSDVEAAAARLASHRVRTPLLNSAALDDAVGARVFVKPECLQRTGSFKFRGAFNRLSMMDDETRAKGIVATSSGNHALGIAEAARHFAVPATIVMPETAPATKIERTRAAGATVMFYRRGVDDRDAIAEHLVAEGGGTYVSPYDDPGVMAGQGTVGLEIIEDITAHAVTADHVLVPTSGGGLLSGVATVFHAAMPDAAILPCEPEGFDDTCRSLRSGRREHNQQATGSIADSLLSERPGRITFAVTSQLAQPGYAVSDAAMREAMAFAARELKLVLEPGGAIALAAALTNAADFAGQTVVVVLTGGNVDPALFAATLAAPSKNAA
ncbi:MAG: threonine/serine dehydratase [Pseudomonadota bacterium]